MARPPRLSVPSYPHHIIQRGNNRQPIFFEEKDYEVFLDCLREMKRFVVRKTSRGHILLYDVVMTQDRRWFVHCASNFLGVLSCHVRRSREYSADT